MASTPERAQRYRGRFGVGTGIAVLQVQQAMTAPPGPGPQGNTCGPGAHDRKGVTSQSTAPHGRKGGQ